MNKVEVKTADLIGPALDWAVGEVEGKWLEEPYHLRRSDNRIWCNEHSYGYCPSEDWAHGGPLIEKHSVWLGAPYGSRRCWNASYHTSCEAHDGDTPLIAACRAIVDAKLGDVVSVPAELVQGGAL